MKKHVVYLDIKAQEYEKIINKEKNMIIRGATGRKLPYGRVDVGDLLYFIRNNGEGIISLQAFVKNVFNSEKMDKEESVALVEKNQDKLNFTDVQKKR